MNEDLPEKTLGKLLREKNLTFCTAESVTGGLIAARMTSVSGASNYFVGGFCTYKNAMKKKILSVPEEIIEKYTEISAPCAEYMALGAANNAECDCAVSVTGLAGGLPGGGVSEDGRNIEGGDGTVFFAVALRGKIVCSEEKHYRGSRNEIRQEAATDCINAVIRALSSAD